jgi:hypothetical protein
VYADLGTVRRRSEVVELRVMRHLEALKDITKGTASAEDRESQRPACL